MYSTSWCSDCYRARSYFIKNKISFNEIDIEKSPEALAAVEKMNNGLQSVPTIVITYSNQPEKILTEPSISDLEEALN